MATAPLERRNPGELSNRNVETRRDSVDEAQPNVLPRTGRNLRPAVEDRRPSRSGKGLIIAAIVGSIGLNAASFFAGRKFAPPTDPENLQRSGTIDDAIRTYGNSISDTHTALLEKTKDQIAYLTANKEAVDRAIKLEKTGDPKLQSALALVNQAISDPKVLKKFQNSLAANKPQDDEYFSAAQDLRDLARAARLTLKIVSPRPPSVSDDDFTPRVSKTSATAMPATNPSTK